MVHSVDKGSQIVDQALVLDLCVEVTNEENIVCRIKFTNFRVEQWYKTENFPQVRLIW